MIKSVIFGIITLFGGMIVIVSTKIGIAKLIEKLIYFTTPTITLAILAGGLFIFFIFFAARFFIWFHNDPRNDSVRKSWTVKPVQSLKIMLGAAAAVVILDSLETMLTLAAQNNESLFWLICPMFIILVFFSAFQQDKLERRSNRNQTNWWIG